MKQKEKANLMIATPEAFLAAARSLNSSGVLTDKELIAVEQNYKRLRHKTSNSQIIKDNSKLLETIKAYNLEQQNISIFEYLEVEDVSR